MLDVSFRNLLRKLFYNEKTLEFPKETFCDSFVLKLYLLGMLDHKKTRMCFKLSHDQRRNFIFHHVRTMDDFKIVFFLLNGDLEKMKKTRKESLNFDKRMIEKLIEERLQCQNVNNGKKMLNVFFPHFEMTILREFLEEINCPYIENKKKERSLHVYFSLFKLNRDINAHHFHVSKLNQIFCTLKKYENLEMK